MKVDSRVRLLLMAFVALWLGSASTCPLNRIPDSVDRAIESFDRAISTLATQSEHWQGTLVQLQNELFSQTQSTLANEVQNLMNRGLATAGMELRCNADFVGTRMRQALERIRARLRGQTFPLAEPAYCQVVPESVDLRLDPSRRGLLSFYGYDMDAAGSAMRVLLMDGSGESDVTSWTAMPTHYLMTINIVNLPFTSTSRLLAVRWGTKTLSTINVVVPPPQAPPPVCTWSSWGCGTLRCASTQYLAGVDFNATQNEVCWGRGDDFDESNRRVKCCNLPSAATSCYQTPWGCGEMGCLSGYHAAGIDANGGQREGCWGTGNDFDEPTRQMQCCQTPPIPFEVPGQCFWSNWGCGAMECPANFYISDIDFNSTRNEACWGLGGDMDEPNRRIKCCPL